MYYIYFTYALIISLLMLWVCSKKNRPKWWAVIVFFAPVTTPWFVFQSKKNSNIVIIIMIFLITFSAVGGTELYLYKSYMEKNYMEKNRHSNLSPVTRQMIYLADKLKASTLKFDNALIELENLSKSMAKTNEIKNSIEFIDQVRQIEIENKNAIINLEKYLNNYKSFFVKKEMSWLFSIKEFYNNYNVVQHHKSLKRYLNSYEDWLKYTYVNFYNITDLKSQEHLRNYDQYYLMYRKGVDSHNKFNVRRIDFQNKFLKLHPKVKQYLPGTRQTDTFKIWG